jgi:hypothetical protein
MTGPIRLREIQAPSDPALWRAYRILQRTFPASELIRAAEFVHGLTRRASGAWNDLLWHIVVGERGQRLEGVVTGTYLAALNIGFIGYLAVDQQERSRGLGATLRDTLLQLFDGDAWYLHGRPTTAVVGEVEPHNPWLDRLVRSRGVLPLDIEYRQPDIRAGKEKVPLVLYYQALTGFRPALPVEEVKSLLFAIWHHAYKVVNPFDDPIFREMIDSLTGREVVGPRPLPAAASSAP